MLPIGAARISEFREKRRWSEPELFDLRRRRAERVMKKLFAEAKRTFSLPKSALGRALGYLIGHEAELPNYLLDARLTPDNNPAENAIRPVVIGRKNFLFVGSQDAGKSAAILCSLAGCCRMNRVNFAEYLNDILPPPGRQPEFRRTPRASPRPLGKITRPLP